MNMDQSVSILKNSKEGYGFSCHLLKDWNGNTLCALNIKDESGNFLFSLHFSNKEQITAFWQHLWWLFDSIEVLDYSCLTEALAESAIKTQSGHIRDDILHVLARLM